jgi:oligopeptide transport system substrate-binding protein
LNKNPNIYKIMHIFSFSYGGKTMKKGIAILLGLVLAASLFAGASSQSSSSRAQELYIMNGTNPQSLDPSQIEGVPEHRIYMALFEGLVRYDPRTAKAIPGVAESWTFSNNNTVITFTIRQGITWSDGTAITAQNIVDSWLYHLNPTTASEYAYMVGVVVKGADDYNTGNGRREDVAIRAVNARTFEVTLVGPVPYAIEMMAHYAFSPLPLHVMERYGNNWTRPENIVGNGPFVLQEYIPNSRVVVVPNTRYWDRANVHLTKITFDCNENDNTMYQAFISGEADWSTGIPVTRIDEVKLHPHYQVSPQAGSYYIIPNTRDHAPLRDVRVRKAISMAINRQELIDNILKGGQLPATAITFPMEGYTPATGNGYNLTEARRLLAEAGYPNGQGLPSFEYVYNSGVESHRVIGEYLQQTLRNNLGINITLQNMEWATFLDYRKTPSMQLGRAGWIADYLDVQNLLDLIITNGGNNDGHYSNAEYDALIRQASTMPDGPARNAILRQAEDIGITRDQALIPLYYYVNQDMINLDIWEGWYPNAMGVHPYVGMRRR